MTNYLDDGNILPEHDHHIVMIFGRKKDHPDLRKSTVCFFQEITRKDFISEKKPLYKAMAEHYNARIYVSVNPINFKAARIDLVKRLIDSMEADTHNNITGQLISSCMKNPRKDKKRFMIDIDTKDMAFVNKISDLIATESIKRKVKLEEQLLPTKNGYHMICKPFDVRILEGVVKADDIKKNGMTVLDYIKDESHEDLNKDE